MKKILGATLTLAVASMAFADPQTPPGDEQSGTAKTGKKAKHRKSKKPKTGTGSSLLN